MTDKLKTWIRDHEDLINSENPSNLIVKMFDSDSLGWSNFIEACKMFVIAGIINKDALMDAFCTELSKITWSYKHDSYNTEEARLGWCVECVGLFPTLKYDDVVTYLLKNHDKYGIQMKPIDQKYWWQPDQPDYDLGWFDPVKFNKWS